MIVVRDLVKAYGRTNVLDGVNLLVKRGETACIIGPSGSGKTTLLRLIAGLDAPDEGEIYIDEVLASSPKFVLPPFKRGISFVFQEPALWPHMTVRANIGYAVNERGENTRAMVEELLKKVGLDGFENRYPGELSMGEARRVALARAIAKKADYMLMDEPLANLNSEIKMPLLELIKKVINDTGVGLVFVTHDEDEASYISDMNYHLSKGKLETGAGVFSRSTHQSP